MRYIEPSEIKEWEKLSALAREAEEKLDALAVAIATSGIPDADKIKALEWVNRAETFRGMSYFCTPQTEWMGNMPNGDGIFKTRAPHICG